MNLLRLLCLLWLALPAAAHARADWISETSRKGDMALVADTAADIVITEGDAEVAAIAARHLAADIARVTGKTPKVASRSSARRQVRIGTLGQMAVPAAVDTSRLKACWECFIIATVRHPEPGVDEALVIVGSDRRGTAYGVYELSRAIGVSPWVWWADVAPERKTGLYVAAGTRKFGPPSVRYRGIFINDEDWGLQPWAAGTFDPQQGNIGPKTYEKVFELLLRLKANTLWPAMHAVATPFNAIAENAVLADRYAIVMGSSHAEPMLRNNVGEWKDAPEKFNYAINAEGVQAYWRERLKTNHAYENIYTLGMRGIHDSGIVGAKTLEERRELLNRIIRDQRAMLAEEVGRPETLPQIFVPYKEVLDIYNGGLDLPDDVTIVWPDDNFGYIRHFPTEVERKRSRGSGVYYHVSYLGAPLSYLWLSTTPPELIKTEMTRAFDHGADRLWIVNAGDIKPAEVPLTYFLDLAWDVPGVRGLSQREWLDGFAAETFGAGLASRIGAVWDDYYRLNFVRRPEHLQWHLPKEAPKASPLSAAEINARIDDLARLRRQAEDVKINIDEGQRDAFFQLVEYPVAVSSLANQRYFAFECAASGKSCETGESAAGADARIKDLTRRYNHEIAGGKWAGFMTEEPADDQWKSFRQIRRDWSKITPGELPYEAQPESRGLEISANGWERLHDLGWQAGNGDPLTASGQAEDGQRLHISILPTFPGDNSDAWRLEVKINDGQIVPVTFPRGPQDRNWAQGVLDNRLTAAVPVPPGALSIEVYARQPGVIVRRMELVADQPAK